MSVTVPREPAPDARLANVMVPAEAVRLLPLASFNCTVRMLVAPVPATREVGLAVTTLVLVETAPGMIERFSGLAKALPLILGNIETLPAVVPAVYVTV